MCKQIFFNKIYISLILISISWTMSGKTVLVTGGAGYIGSHCVVTLQEAGYEVIALDNFTNSVDDGCDGSLALKRVEKITGKPVKFYKCDLLDTAYLEKIFQAVSKMR